MQILSITEIGICQIFKIKGNDYSLVGYTNRPSSKKPFIILNLTNKKQYLVSEEQVVID